MSRASGSVLPTASQCLWHIIKNIIISLIAFREREKFMLVPNERARLMRMEYNNYFYLRRSGFRPFFDLSNFWPKKKKKEKKKKNGCEVL